MLPFSVVGASLVLWEEPSFLRILRRVDKSTRPLLLPFGDWGLLPSPSGLSARDRGLGLSSWF